MIYLIVYLLDFYPSLLKLLDFFIFFGTIYFIGSMVFTKLFEKEYQDYLNNKYYSDQFGYVMYSLASLKLKGWHLVLAVVINTILPSSKGLYILTGMYVGEKTLDKVQESPLYDKAYKLAEAKLNELLDGANLTLENKKNESKK